MQADAFWKNYMAAQEWQKRHSIAWWKSRCLALEYENKVLRNKLKDLASSSQQNIPKKSAVNGNEWEEEINEERIGDEIDSDEDEDEDFEFHVNEDMMSFLEQSIRHKIELHQKRESELATALNEDKKLENTSPPGSAAWAKGKNTNAKLLYGEASPRILAMEAALQATMDRHKEQAKPQFWPNIPLKL